jgi:putative addiction module component (TIGR02574 family)
MPSPTSYNIVMTAETQRLLAEALSLPPVERATLLEEILSSFDFPDRKEIDAAWAKEAEDRIDAHDRSEIKSTSADELFEKINGQETP